MKKSEYITASANARTLTFKEKVTLNCKTKTLSIREFKEFLKFRYPNLSGELNFITDEYIHRHKNSDKETYFRIFADGILIDEKKYISFA